MAEATLTCEEIEELLPQYALGALSADEAAAVARHLHTCSEHADTLDAYEAVCEGLGASVPLVDPPDRVRARLLASLARPSAAAHRGRGARIAWAVAVVAAALAIGLGVWGLSLQRQMDAQAARREQFVALARQPDVHMVPLQAAAGSPAKGVLIYTGSQAAVWAVALPALEGDQVYECWWIGKDNGRVSGGTFRPSESMGVWIISMPGSAQNYYAISITLEPNDERDEPQGPNVLSGEF